MDPEIILIIAVVAVIIFVQYIKVYLGNLNLMIIYILGSLFLLYLVWIEASDTLLMFKLLLTFYALFGFVKAYMAFQDLNKVQEE